MKFDVVIPTLNSGNTLEDTLISIKKTFNDKLGDIIIIDGFSDDNTVSIANKYKCKVVISRESLGDARKTGVLQCKTDFIFFIDSDIIVNKKWLNRVLYYFEDKGLNVGMIFGFTISMNEYDAKQKQYRMKLRFKNSDIRRLNKGQRGYTHNTLVIRDIFKYIDFKDVYSWEDYIITNKIIDSGLGVFEINESVFHNHNEDIYKVETWNMAGYRNVIGISPYIFKKIAFNFLWGVFCTIRFIDMMYFFINIKIIFANLKGFIFYKKYIKKLN